MKIKFRVLAGILLMFSLFSINCSDEGKSDGTKKRVHEPGKLTTGWYHISDGITPIKRKLVKSKFSFYIDSVPIITADNFMKVEINELPNAGADKYYGLKITLDMDGKDRWGDATGRWTGKRMAMIVDDSLIDIPLINNENDSGVTVVNGLNQTKEEAENIKKILESEQR